MPVNELQQGALYPRSCRRRNRRQRCIERRNGPRLFVAEYEAIRVQRVKSGAGVRGNVRMPWKLEKPLQAPSRKNMRIILRAYTQTHTHAHSLTGPDCAVRCNLLNTHT